MELINPMIVTIGIIVMLILIVIPFGKKTSFKEGKKVANTELVEQTEFYKKLKRRYTIINVSAVVCLIMAIVAGLVLVARPSKVETINTELRNRDIFLCMDVSNSVDELNVPLCEKIKGVVKSLAGERVGITIFNGQTVLLVPLTSDYDYVLETIDDLEASIKLNLKWTEADYDSTGMDEKILNYKHNGTLSDKGSSLIGDGLAGCLYNFVDLEENKDRTRIIIFTTDNELSGTPYVSLEEAADLCKKNNVKVYGLAPENPEDEETFRRSVEKTGGVFYECTSDKVYDQLVSDIQKTDKSTLNIVETVRYDKPELVLGVLIISLAAYFVLSKVVKK